ncbi:MAG: type II toxin-antitoxin system VapC family toxin [Blastocatellales bacterium]
MYLLDTDTLSALHKDNPHVVASVARADAKVATTIITKIEILRGRIEFVRKAATGDEVLRAQQWLNRSEELLALLEIVPFDAAAAKLFDGLRSEPGLGKIGRADLLIASIALAQRATLVTRNLRDFQAVPRLSVRNWMD